MSRSYGPKFLLELAAADPNSLGVRLGRLCVNANIPAAYAAVALEVTRMTVYSWFRGKGVNEKKGKLIEVFMDMVGKDLADGVLPAKDTKDAKRYIESLIGIQL